MRNDASRNNGKNKIGRATKFIAVLSCAMMLLICLSTLVAETDCSAVDVYSADEGEIVIGEFKYTRVSPGSTDLIFRGYVTLPSEPVDLVIHYEVSDGGTNYHVKEVGEQVFCSMHGANNAVVLNSVEMDDGIERIGNHAFDSQVQLLSVKFPATLKEIGESVFADCTGLGAIEIPDSVTSVGALAFSGCSGIESLKIGSGLTVLTECCFAGFTNLRELKIGDNVKVIEESCFMNMCNLRKLIIPDSVVVIGDGAFGGCLKITELTIGKNVGYIGDGGFSGLSSIRNLVIPENVHFIGNYAFSGMDMVRHIEFRTNYCYFERQAFGQDFRFFSEDGRDITDSIELCGKTFDMKNGSMVCAHNDATVGLDIALAIVALLSLIIMAGIFRR